MTPVPLTSGPVSTGWPERYVRVLEAAARGLRNRDISEEIGCSPRTVEGIVRDAAERLEAKNRPHAVASAIRRDLIAGPENAKIRFDALTEPQRKVALKVAEGATAREAGEELGFSERTVRAHVVKAQRVVGARTSTALAAIVAAAQRPPSFTRAQTTTPVAAASDIRFEILGPLTARSTADGPSIPLGEKAAAVLARLLVADGRWLDAATLVEDIWGNRELSNGRNSLQSVVRLLRSQLGDTAHALIVQTNGGYRLACDPGSVDAARFRMLTESAWALREKSPHAAKIMFNEALSSWRGPLLGGIDRHWARALADEMETRRDRAQVALNEIRLELGEHEDLEVELRRQLASHPLDERRHAQLIRSLTSMRRDVDAHVAFREAVRAIGGATELIRAAGEQIDGRSDAARRTTPGTFTSSEALVLHASPRSPDTSQLAMACLIAARAGGRPFPHDDGSITAAFDDPAAAMDAASRLTSDGATNWSVAVDSGSVFAVGTRLAGQGPSRSRTLAASATAGQVLVTERARAQYWPDRKPDVSPPQERREYRAIHLPLASTRFVGRSHELRTIIGAVVPGTLVTLVGPGGYGKTRLALQAAARRAEAFADGSWFVGLADLDAAAGTETVAASALRQLGLRQTRGELASEALVRQVEDRHALIVLDNCEHVLDACRYVVSLLRERCPRLCVLATSRTRLGLSGEHLLSVGSMRTAPAAMDDMPDAVELFLERLGPTLGTFSRSPSALLDDMTRICTSLDGSPLAIELVAGRVATHGLEAVSAEVEAMIAGEIGLEHFSIDDPRRAARQRTIEETLQWSYDLLDETQQRTLGRLSVFRGSFSIAEAREVVSGDDLAPGDVAVAVSSLIDASFVRAEPAPATGSRLRLHEAVRAFASDRLGRDERARTKARHAEAYVALASHAAKALFGPGEERALKHLETNLENLRCALGALIAAQRTNEASELTSSLWWLWLLHGHHAEGLEHIRSVLALDDSPSAARTRVLRAGLQLSWVTGEREKTASFGDALEVSAAATNDVWGLGWARLGKGLLRAEADPAEALESLEDSRRRFSSIGATWDAAYALHVSADLHDALGADDHALRAYEAAGAAFEDLGHVSMRAASLRGAGTLIAQRGERERGRAMCRHALSLSEAVGDVVGVAQALSLLADISRDEGDLRPASDLYAHALSRAGGTEDVLATCRSLDGIAQIAQANGDVELAVRLMASSRKLLKRAGYPRTLPATVFVSVPAPALSRADYDRATTEGELMNRNEAVTAALAFARGLRADR